MKIRNSFVSNSSSSSFIVYSNEEVTEDFLKSKVPDIIPAEYFDNTYSKDEIINSILNNIKSNTASDYVDFEYLITEYYFLCLEYTYNDSYMFVRKTLDNIEVSKMSTDIIKEYKEYLKLYNIKGPTDWDLLDNSKQKLNELLLNHAKAQLNLQNYKFLNILEYGDDNDFGSIMEHSDILYKIFNYVQRISNH